MKSILHMALACMTGLAAGSWAGDVAAAKGATAKARLAEARAAAAKWQPDATLVTASTLRANDDGTGSSGIIGWNYTFHSPKTGKWIGFWAGPCGLESQSLTAGLKVRVPDGSSTATRSCPIICRLGHVPHRIRARRRSELELRRKLFSYPFI